MTRRRKIGIIWNDVDLNLAWPLSEAAPNSTPILSAKDADLGRFKDFASPFEYDGGPLTLIEE